MPKEALPAANGAFNANSGGEAMFPKAESYARMTWRRLKKHKLATVGLYILLALYVIAIFAPVLAPYSYSKVDPPNRLQPPSAQHWFGTDDIGRDIFSRMVWGSRISLAVGFVAAGVSVLLGTIIGSLSAYYGGWVDIVLMRFTEIIMAFPTFFLLLTIVAIIERNIFNIMLVIGLTSWPGLARMVRGQVLSLKEQEFTEAARALGANDSRIIFRHILPNAMAQIIVSATLGIGGAILSESSLSFLGLGVPEPYPSWGSILNAGRTFILKAPWITTIAGLAIFLTVLAFNYLGNGLRDALDPKLKD